MTFPEHTTVASNDVVRAPLGGRVVRLEDVPDPVFSGKFVGPGLALDPERVGPMEAVAPLNGTVVKVHPHAFIVVDAQGQAVLTHLGLDTVTLAGDGFTVHVSEGETVRAGQAIVTWNPEAVAQRGMSPLVPVIALEADEAKLALAAPSSQCAAGDVLWQWH